MTRFLLLRHAAHDLAGRALAGRLAGLGLNAAGEQQAAALARHLARQPIDAIYSSPQPRTRATAAPIARALGLELLTAPEFDEIDFGEWTGCSFEAVRAQYPAQWAEWVDHRSQATPPGGEPFAQVQRRACAGIERLRQLHPEHTVAVVSHADVLKAVLATHLGVNLDGLERFELACASISVLEAGEGWSQVKLLNGAATEPACR